MFNGPVFNNEVVQANSRAVNNAGVSEALDKANALYSRLTGASFELIPSSYKAGTVFAGAPNTGNGDLTWTRASTANRTNSAGNIELMGLGVPRLSYMYGSAPALLLEPQRTNSIRNSSMVGAAAGSPGTLPNNWASALLSGLTQTIVGTGTERGVP